MRCNKTNSKILFWIFGIVFSVVLYFVLTSVNVFLYISQTVWLPIFIILIVLILFFVIGNFSSKIPSFFFCSLFNKKQNLSKLKEIIAKKESQEDIDLLVKRIKSIFNSISASKYSEESIVVLINLIGVDKEHAQNIVKNIVRLRALKRTCWILGIILFIIIYILIIRLPIFSFITVIPVLPFAVAFTVLLLFVLEGILITRMPESFYLDLVKINKHKIIDNKIKLTTSSKDITNYQEKQKQDIQEIKQTLRYLLKQHDLNKKWIEKILTNYNISEKVAKQFIDEISNEISNKEKVVPKSSKAQEATIKLSLAKIHENFMNLKSIYNKLSLIQKDISSLSDRQKELETVSKSKIMKDLKDYSKKEINKSIKTKLTKFKSKMENEKNTSYYKMIVYLYNLVLPNVSKYSEKSLFGLLISDGLSYEVTSDVIKKLKDNNIMFGKRNIKLQEVVVNKVNSIYDKFSKSKK